MFFRNITRCLTTQQLSRSQQPLFFSTDNMTNTTNPWWEEYNSKGLEFQVSRVPQQLIGVSGWSAPTGAAKEIPFAVERTNKGKNLPVYRDYRNGRTRIITQVRKVLGCVDTLCQELSKILPKSTKIQVRSGSQVIYIYGDYRKEIILYLKGLGY
mmetsp:Transcript_10240/g.15429  ORF Transcript_10240/g.15429 Transcript_10240/m.15429 type:complete len:155 (-) Transcript_10240:14-478(-)